MDAEAAIADTPHGQPVPAEGARSSAESVRNWMEMAVHHIGQGEPSPALKAVFQAATLLGGEEAALQTMVHFKQVLKKQLGEGVGAISINGLPSLLAGCSFTVDELVSLITKCAATDEANPSQSNEVDESVEQQPGRNQVAEEAADTPLTVMRKLMEMVCRCFGH